METKTVKAKLVAKETDYAQYTTYVFKIDENDSFYNYSNYCMAVRYPNWDHRSISIGEQGYLKFIEVIAGEDKYWNGVQFTPYNYSNWQFIKFVAEPTITSNKIVVD